MERFTPKVGTNEVGEVWHQIQADPGGEWVRYTDHLSDKREALEKIADELLERAHAAGGMACKARDDADCEGAAIHSEAAAAHRQDLDLIRSEIEKLDG